MLFKLLNFIFVILLEIINKYKYTDKIPYWQQCIEINRRVLDPAQFYINWTKDIELPNLSTCKQRAGLDSNVSHNAIEDAWDVIMLLRKQY
jgi:hypothetical protein